VIANCIIAGNVSNEGGEGAGIFCRQSGPTVTNCTICDNSGDGMMCYDGSCPVVINCVFWGNSLGQIVAESGGSYIGSSTPVVAFSDVQGGWPGDGNIDTDPCFAQPGAYDPNGTPRDPSDDSWIEGDYHLKSQAGRWDPDSQAWVQDDVTSPCIDAGDVGKPIGFEPFPNGGIINMGAFGGTKQASKSYFGEVACGTIVAGDINGDCRVDFADFAIIAFHWLEEN
jgi:hypothetical protein